MPGILTAVWALIVPWAGPLAERALPYLGWVPSLAGLKRALRVGTYLAVLAAGIWAGAQFVAWCEGDKLTLAEAKERAAEAIAAANLTAKEEALAAREAHLAERERLVAIDGEAIEKLEGELRHARENSGTAGAVALGADDEWLRAWMAVRR